MLKFQHCVFAENKSDEHGGAIFAEMMILMILADTSNKVKELQLH